MSNKHLHINTSDDLNQEILLAYVRGQLSATDTQRIDRLVAQDDFLKDAVEGLKNTAGVSLDKRLRSIHEQIDAATGTKKVITLTPMIRKYAAAASLLIFFAATLLIMRKLNAPDDHGSIALENTKSDQPLVTDNSLMHTDTGMGSGNIAADTMTMSDLKTVTATTTSTNETYTTVIVPPVTTNQNEEAKNAEPNLANAGVSLSEVSLPESSTDDVDLFTKTTAADKVADEETVTTVASGSTKETIAKDNAKQDKKATNKKKSTEELAAPAASMDGLSADSTKLIYDFAEVMPVFPGGNDSLYAFFNHHLLYPAQETVEGTVYIRFVVNEDGSISDAHVIRSLAPKFDAEALRVVNLMPNWSPGKTAGENVRVNINLPIRFSQQ